MRQELRRRLVIISNRQAALCRHRSPWKDCDDAATPAVSERVTGFDGGAVDESQGGHGDADKRIVALLCAHCEDLWKSARAPSERTQILEAPTRKNQDSPCPGLRVAAFCKAQVRPEAAHPPTASRKVVEGLVVAIQAFPPAARRRCRRRVHPRLAPCL